MEVKYINLDIPIVPIDTSSGLVDWSVFFPLHQTTGNRWRHAKKNKKQYKGPYQNLGEPNLMNMH